jgi:hypothetical protein
MTSKSKGTPKSKDSLTALTCHQIKQLISSRTRTRSQNRKEFSTSVESRYTWRKKASAGGYLAKLTIKGRVLRIKDLTWRVL